MENAIGRMRRTLPRKTDSADISDGRLAQLVRAYNNTSPKCLGFRTPAEILQTQVLHVKCESTAFRNYLGIVGIKHILESPIHPPDQRQAGALPPDTKERCRSGAPYKLLSDLRAAVVAFVSY